MLDRRRALMAQKAAPSGRIPPEYQEVEWIKASTSATLDTGLVPTSMPRIVTEVKISDTTNAVRAFWGLGTSSATPYYMFANNYIKASNAQFWIGSSTVEFASNPLKQTANWVSLDVSTAVKINGSTAKTVTAPDYSNNERTLYLFRACGSHGPCAMKTVEIYLSGEKVRELIPCYRKSDTKIGMYDLITSTFYPSSGTFTKGDDVVS